MSVAKDFDRRRFLHGSCALFTVACAGDPTTKDTLSPTDTDTPTPPGGHSETEPTPFADYPCDQVDVPDASWTELTLAEYPDLADEGGWYGVNTGGRDIVVAHVVEGCYSAVSRACTHEGVLVNYEAARAQFICPRHGAVYSASGERVSGPQPAGIVNYPCVRQGDSVFVLLS